MPNTQRPTKFNLEERLLDYSADVIRLSEKIIHSPAGSHVSNQILRSGTSPLPNHGEAEAAESTQDFIHKLKICLKELWQTYRWIRLIQRVPLIERPESAQKLLQETDELIRIFYKSIETARNRPKRPA
jgi:four helix bundle protein